MPTNMGSNTSGCPTAVLAKKPLLRTCQAASALGLLDINFLGIPAITYDGIGKLSTKTHLS